MVLIWGLRGDLVLVDQFGFCVWLHWYSIFSKSPTNVSKSSKTIKNVKPPSSPFTFYVASSFSLEFFITISHFLFGKHTIFVILLDSCYSSSLWMHPSNRNNTSSDYLLSFSLSNSLLILCIEILSFFFFCFHKSRVCFDGCTSYREMNHSIIEIPPQTKNNTSNSMK